jgi:hypothetical protein
MGERGLEHDPDKHQLQQIARLHLPVRPISAAWVRRQDGEVFPSSQQEGHYHFEIVRISIASDHEATVDVNERPLGTSGQRFTYSLVLSGGKWSITKEEPGPLLG